MNYLEIKIFFTDKNKDLIYNALYLYNIKSILEEDNYLTICGASGDYSKFKKIKDALISRYNITENNISVQKIKNENWNKKWEKSIDIINVKDKLIVYPSWKKHLTKKHGNKILIEIDPKMSFGTGHNETTQIMLEFLMDEIESKDKKLLDYGCGTAILAIAGVKAGIRKAVAIDNDDDSIENAIGYIKKNNSSKKISLYNCDIDKITEDKFDIVCANIISSVLIKNMKLIKRKSVKGGKIFLSGILREEEEKMRNVLKENNLDLVKIIYKAEWLGIYAKKL
jgi:ribosomal protein L11 methyltransferase